MQVGLPHHLKNFKLFFQFFDDVKGIAMKSRFLLGVVASALLCFASSAEAQYARQAMLPFESTNVSASDFLQGKKGTPVMIAGHLRLPKMEGKQPVVVLMHGAPAVGGSEAQVDTWARALNEAGIGAFVVDSFSGRGVNSFADLGKISPLVRVADAYGALNTLSKHPLVDSSKIAVMGFSHGGPSAIYSDVQRFQKMLGPDAKFAAHIGVYPICNVAYKDDAEVTSPLLLLHGAADDWVPSKNCKEYADRLTKAGKHVRYIEYPDAHHVFDAPVFKQEMKFAQINSLRKCHFAESEGGIIINAESKQPTGPNDPCFEKGVTAAYNEAATKKAHEDVKAFLKGVFGS
ncbi:dienelactone hydrolase family protein [Bradyrhizobium sp. OAE829]|uniref:dienelactone hydrolase family protein n=1 Tax=Bradyrhizobium sp. OAE829 TaxID=2663807 RepID=UPI00178AEC77